MAEYTISVENAERALSRVKANKSTGPDGIHPWLLRVPMAIDSPQPFSTVLCGKDTFLRNGNPRMWSSTKISPRSVYV